MIKRTSVFILTLIGIVLTQACQPSKDATSFHDEIIVFDGHNDALLLVMAGEDLGQSPSSGHTDLPRLKEGGVDVQVFAVWSDASGDYDYANKQIDALMQLIAQYPDAIALAKTAQEMKDIQASGKIAAVLTVEGGHMINERLDYLESLHERGVRALTLTWNNSVSWATSAWDETQQTDTLEHKGLNDFGRQVILKMNDLGMIIDLSHAGRQTFYDVLETSTKPVWVSHSNAYALARHSRNLDDDQIQAIKEQGGVIGVNFYSAFLDADFSDKVQQAYANHVGTPDEGMSVESQFSALPDAGKEEIRPDLKVVIDHIDYLVERVGINQVAIGSDFDGIDSSPKQLSDVLDFRNLTNALLDHGYSKEDVQKIMGENLLRLFRENE